MQHTDTISFCLSKGLCCPVGSVLCGPAEKIRQARRWRKMLGGGMRQAGVLAAAGLVALDTMVDRLADDHQNARALAEGLAGLPGIDCDLSRVQTNLVYFRLKKMDATSFLAACSREGLLGGAHGPDLVRFVTHHGIGAPDVRHALVICRDVLRGKHPAAGHNADRHIERTSVIICATELNRSPRRSPGNRRQQRAGLVTQMPITTRCMP